MFTVPGFIGGAAIFAILLSCVGKLAAAIQMIPLPVMGGVSLLLYGVIGASGIRVLIESKVDYNKAQNLILTSVILIIGVSGAKVNHRRGGVKRYGAGDHRRYRLKFDLQTD
ncbi:uracil transporter [Escherichia coli]|uniref:Uracil transporter n=1 Tax=Escherichia coli TaxID=562 RepID=A0A2X1MCC8_ECOLX|nr:uracil transporter [Escherichia coli]